jgi:predicted acyltransferase (DUF342 family)
LNRSVKSSSNIELSNGIEVDGKVSSSSHVTLSNNVIVHEKIDSSSKITLFEGVKVDGKLAARGSIDLRNGVSVGDKVDGKLVPCSIDASARKISPEPETLRTLIDITQLAALLL